MSDDLIELPARPFYSCDDDGFAIVDSAMMRNASMMRLIEPVLHLHIGPGNIFETRPREVVGRDGDVVTVACDEDVTVVLDFAGMAARKQTPEGEYIYMGGLDEGNDGKGFIRAR